MNGQEPKAEPEKGLRCRKCNCGHFITLETRKQPDKVVRRRECRHCGTRITTSEKVVG